MFQFRRFLTTIQNERICRFAVRSENDGEFGLAAPIRGTGADNGEIDQLGKYSGWINTDGGPSTYGANRLNGSPLSFPPQPLPNSVHQSMPMSRYICHTHRRTVLLYDK